MVDFDMSIINNKDLGEANHLPFLDETEAQLKENRQAEAEGRPARTVLRRQRFGVYAGQHEIGPIEFAEEEPEITEETEDQYFSNQEMEKDAPLIALEEKSSDETLNSLLEEYKEEVTETNE